jgi:hypothetical protein
MSSSNLNPGDYKVQVVAPSGYYVTKQDVGATTSRTVTSTAAALH